MRKIYTGSNNQLKAIVREFKPLGQWNGQYCTYFYALDDPDYDYRGNNGLGMKVYDTKEKAIAAAKRYVKRWEV